MQAWERVMGEQDTLLTVQQVQCSKETDWEVWAKEAPGTTELEFPKGDGILSMTTTTNKSEKQHLRNK